MSGDVRVAAVSSETVESELGSAAGKDDFEQQAAVGAGTSGEATCSPAITSCHIRCHIQMLDGDGRVQRAQQTHPDAQPSAPVD